MSSSKYNRRVATRREVATLHAAFLTSLDDLAKIARNCEVVEASATGLLLLIKREDFIPQSLRKNLNVDTLIGDRVFINIEEMNLEISGTIARTQLVGKKGFHVAIDYSDDAPEYWRECLMDLLPRPGELE